MARKRSTSAVPAPPLPSGGDEAPAVFGALPPFDTSVERLSEPVLVEVTLLKPHNHSGRDYAAGDKLTVRPPVAQWLRDRGVIAPTSQDPA